jgi:two-component system chemotaxis response regulator CheB
MGNIRVLIVDDAVVVRRIVADVLSQDPDLEVVATAATGRIALAKLPQVNPDVIILDVEMPEMDGLATLAAIRKTYPALPVIMFSTVTQRGAAATLDALALGANDYVTKPANVGSVTVAMQRIREELIPKIKALCVRTAAVAARSLDNEPKRVRPPVRNGAKRHSVAAVEIVAIGVSTGGPNALAALLTALPEDFPVPIVIVQHMPPIFTRFLAERLDSKAAVRVVEAASGDLLRPGGVWIAPGDYHLGLLREGKEVRLRTHRGPPENSCRPA